MGWASHGRPGVPSESALWCAIAMLSFVAVSCTSTSLNSTGPSTTKCSVSATSTAGAIAAVGGTTTVSVTADPECAWKASTNVNWIAEVTPDAGQGSAAVTVRATPNGDPVQRRGSVQIASVAIPITQDAAACVFSVAPLTRDVSASSGTATVSVTANGACGWTAESGPSWLSVIGGASGSGNGVVTVAFAANPGATRSGVVTVAGQTVTFNQAALDCSYSLSGKSQIVGASGGTAVPVTVATTASCNWNAGSNVPWVTVSAGASGTGTGNVTLTVAPNTGVERIGTLTIAAQTYTVTQSAAAAPGPPPPPAACTFTLTPGSASVGSAGGAGSPVAVTTNSSCAWSASSNASWITIISGTGTGNGSVSYSVGANAGAARTAAITIAGQTFTVNQAGVAPACNYGINPTDQSFSASGGQGSPVSVTASNGCAWTAASNVGWITVNTGSSSGSGNGSVSYGVAVNTGAVRTGTITIANQTFTVNQAAAAPACSFGINPTSQSFSAVGGANNTVSVTASNGCAWTAASNDSWITVNSGSSGSGNGSVRFTVAVNAGAARTGTMIIAGQTFTVTQAVNCTYQINPTHQSFGLSAGTGTIAVTAPASCTWTAISTAEWITVTSGLAGSGNGTVAFSVAAASNNKDRNGAITIATQTFTVNQKKD